MEKQTANELMEDIVQLIAQLNVIAQKVESMTPESELKLMRRHIGNMMAAIDENLFRPILRQYPDLDPHR